MARLSLLGGSYLNKSVIAACQSSINLYAEDNPEAAQSPVPVTHYQTPGLNLLRDGQNSGTVRCTYRASNDVLYVVIAQTVYIVNQNFVLTAVGTINSTQSPVSMADNGSVIIIVDNSGGGYALDLNSHEFGVITGADFYGGTRVCFLDLFFILNKPNTTTFYISLGSVTYVQLVGGTAFVGTDFGIKSGYPDNIVSIAVVQGYIWLIGSQTTEIWYDAGTSPFPFARLPGVNIIEHGTPAPYSVSTQDLFPYWITQDKQGQGIIIKVKNYQADRISTNALENEFLTYPTLDDCISYIYQQEGHVFVVFTFPTANKTWVYDESTGQWHQRAWTDNNGVLNRHRGNCCANAYGKIVVGDWQNGNLYAFDLSTYTDNGQPISRIRTFPHLINDGNRQVYTRFIADMAVGNDTGLIDSSTSTNPPMVSLRWSDDRGVSYGNRIEQSLGATGAYLTSIQWRRLGLARDRIFELSWSAPCNTALQGAWLEVLPSAT